jgi:hypothetical protein
VSIWIIFQLDLQIFNCNLVDRLIMSFEENFRRLDRIKNHLIDSNTAFFSWRINFTGQTAPIGAGVGQVLEVAFDLDDL